MTQLGGQLPDETTLLIAYRQHIALLEDRTQATVDTYLAHTRTFCRYLTANHDGVALNEVSPFNVRAFLLHEANRGMTPSTRSTELFALRSFYRFLIAEDLCQTNPAKAVTLPAPSRGRVEFYKDDEADAVIDWVSSQTAVRWQVGRVLLMFLRYTGLRLSELTKLRIEDVDLDARRICLVGKGRKERVVPIPAPLGDC